MKNIACPVGHIVQELVFPDNYVGIPFLVRVTKVRVLDVNRATCCSDVFAELILSKDDGALVAFNHKSCNVFQSLYHEIVVPL